MFNATMTIIKKIFNRFGAASSKAKTDSFVFPTEQEFIHLFAHELERRRSTDLTKAPKSRLVSELVWIQRCDHMLQGYLNHIAVEIYQGRHPKHWLWKSHKQWFLDRVHPGERILDGCGASAYLLWMSEKGCIVTGCDINPERIEQARSLMQHPNLSFEVRDVMQQIPVRPFDTVICSHVIAHLDDPVPMLSALRKNASRLLVAVPPEDNRWQKLMFRDCGLPWKDDEDHRREYSPPLLRQHLEDAGWTLTESHAGIDIKAAAVVRSEH